MRPPDADREHADEQHRGEGEVRDDAEHPDEAGVERDALHLGVVDGLRLALVAVEGDLGPAERLEHPDALGALLDRGREVAGLVLDVAHDPLVPPLEAVAQDQHRDGRHERERAPARRAVARSTAKMPPTWMTIRTKNTAPKPTNRRIDAEVGHRPGQELARLPAVVEPDVERWSWA